MTRRSVVSSIATLAAAFLSTAVLSAVYARGQPETVYRPGNGVTLPRLVKEVKPQYTPDAMAARIEGAVTLECVVQSSGSVGDVRVVISLDTEHGLDEQAVIAAKQWVFEPGTREGKPVAVRVTVVMNFTLK